MRVAIGGGTRSGIEMNLGQLLGEQQVQIDLLEEQLEGKGIVPRTLEDMPAERHRERLISIAVAAKKLEEAEDTQNRLKTAHRELQALRHELAAAKEEASKVLRPEIWRLKNRLNESLQSRKDLKALFTEEKTQWRKAAASAERSAENMACKVASLMQQVSTLTGALEIAVAKHNELQKKLESCVVTA